MRQIEDAYIQVRQSEGDKEIQKKLFLVIKKLQQRLREEAKIRKIIYLTRHGETISDTPDGPPGSDDEILNQDGEKSSLEK